jgi:hypothetical protein
MDNAHLRGGELMSVKIEWQVFEAEAQSDGTWNSNSPALAELLNAIASPDKIKEPVPDIEHAMAHLAIKGLPYFKITETTSGNTRVNNSIKKSSRTIYANMNSQVKPSKNKKFVCSVKP